MWEAAAIVVIVASLLFWVDSLRARERALAAGRAACARNGLQFLDETVAGASLRLARNEAGELRIRRVFAFEFSDTGDNRRQGSIVMLGGELQDLQMEPYKIQ
jgi:hypothetical protein